MAFTERFRSTIFKSMLRRATLRFSAASAICLLVSALALAQGARGTISGQVTDASGAVIAGATVSLKNVATQQQRTVVTDNNGSYQFLEIEPATYNLTVSAKGFSDALLQEATLEPSRHLTLDVSLKAAGVTEQVSVTAGQELIDRESATLGTTVDNKRVVGLPLNGRNILDLALLQPGVAPVATAGSFGSGEGFRVNGARAVENNFTLDGSNNNEIAVGSDFGNEPRPDAVQEFRVLTGNYDAEYGRDAGSVINVVVKGGTNRFHGDARLFYRPTFLSAGRFFDNMAHLPVRRFERKEIGGNFGGPLDIPHVYNGKDKTFFFFDFETRRQLVGNSQTLTGLPTVNERNGIFSHTIVDPATGKPFPNNTIDPTRISPIAKYYLNFIPIGDASGRATVQANEITNNDYITARLDHQINSKQTVNFIANYFQSSDATPFAFGGANVPGFGAVNLQNTYNYVFHHTYAISSTLINSFLISYVRNNSPAVSPVNTTTPQQIGFTANFVADAAFAGPPNVRLLDRGLNLGNTIQGPQARISQNFQLQDSV
ncbi:MAG TPA: carboxypeptidase regulatory-like domain-containing protein, partial [Blastocatellia bacterium]|nr:carboxypeptidase regulatory-like domain-containing protein [Blastocatellia bacterium]